MRRLAAVLAAGLALSACTPTSAPAPSTPTGPARQQLDSLAVAAPHASGYVRTKFGPGWASQGHGCDTREVVLKNQGQNVRTDAACRAVSGTWTSPYDGKTYTQGIKLQIDHVVPLGNAWGAGAWSWTDARRQAFANDLSDPELLAVSASLNEAKGDKGPEAWKPPLRSFWPTYAADWVAVKAKYRLTVTASEKTALLSMLG